MATGKKVFKKIGRIFLWLLVGIFSLIILLFIFINLPLGKRFIRNQVQSYLQDKLKTRIEIGAIDFSLPEWVEIKNIYVEDQRKDTLLFATQIKVDIHLLKLIRGNTDIEAIKLQNIIANVNRPLKDSVFNYQFIVDAFSGNNPSTPNTDTSEMKLSIRRLAIDTLKLSFKDQYGGTDFYAGIKKLDLKMQKFQPDRMMFLVKDLEANGVDYFMRTYKSWEPVPQAVAVDTVEGKSYPLLVTAGKIDLRNVNVLLDDEISGMHYSNAVTHIGTSNSLFSIGSSMGTTDELYLDSSQIVFSSPRADTTTAETDHAADASPMPWIFSGKKINIRHTSIKYDDINKPRAEGLDYAHLNIKNLNTGIKGFRFSQDSTTALIEQLAFADSSGFQLDSTHVDFAFTNKGIKANELYLKTPGTLIQRSVEVKYDSIAAITTAPQNSSVNVNLDHSRIAFNDLFLLVPALKKSLNGFTNQYIDINTQLKGTLAQLDLPYFQLSGLSGSRLSARGTLYNITDTNKFAFDIFILQGNFFKRDFIKFIPQDKLASFKDVPESFNLAGHFKGNKNDIVADISTSAKDFSFSGHVNLNDISDPAKLKYDVAVSNLSTDKNLITGFIPPEALASINLPQKITAAGTLTGNTNNIKTDMKVKTSYGDLAVKGFVNNIKNTDAATYDLVLNTGGFDAGKLLMQDSIFGVIAGTFKAKGTGFDYKKMRSSIEADIASAVYNKHNYKNAKIKADLDNGEIVSKGSIDDDPAVKLNYDLTANVKGEYPTVKGMIRIDTVQLKELHFYEDTLNLSLTTNIDLQNLQPRNLNAALLLDSIRVQLKDRRYELDSVSLVGSSSAGIDSIILRSPFADADAGGAFDYDKVALSLQKFINGYYKIPGYQPPNIDIPDQQLAVHAVIKNNPIITDAVKGLDYDNIDIKGNYVSADKDSALKFNVQTNRLVYNGTRFSHVAADVHSSDNMIHYEAGFDTLNTTGNTLYVTSVKGTVANDSIVLTARTADKAKKDWFAISGTAAIKEDVYSFRMKDTLLLNYEQWNVSPGNYLSYSPRGIIVNNLLLTSDTASISVKSQQLTENSPIDINIDNFNLKSITSLVNQDTLLFSGILDVKANVSDLDKELPGFTGNASINNLTFKQASLGDLNFTAKKQSENNIAADLSLAGNGNDITANGNYYLNQSENQFDVNVLLKKLNFKTIEALSGGEIKNASGNITGELKAGGKFADPRWNGEINFDTTSFSLAMFGAPYKINKQKIILQHPSIKFPEFIIKDSLGHDLKIDGDITIRSMEDIGLNLDINTQDFIFLNARKGINSQLYGYGALDANISVTGTAVAPNIDGDIEVNNESDITLVLPESSYAKDDGKTIVRFIDRDTFDINPPVVGFEEATKPQAAFGKFLNYNLNIQVNKEASLSILLDPSTGDQIQVQGDARLNAGVDPGGNIVLAGTYELDKGYYDLHYQFLERKFNLIKGSTITFAGTPLNASVNITAEYIANTNSRDLLSSEVSDVNPTLANSFNQKLPFRVILKLSGQLNKPTISFDIELPEQGSNVLNSELRTTIENKLQQIRSDPASINKQVFSLLIFGRFVSEQSSDFFKSNGSDFSMLARQSVSQFLSSALNQIASDIFKGIDIDLNLNSYNDYSNGGNTQRTDLNVAVSKKFANDRIIVSVGQNFGIEGQDAAAKASGSNSGFRPDISIAYRLTRDGRYLLRAYTKNQFEVTVDGYVVETGLAFVVTMDYEKFRQLFRTRKGKREKK